MVRAFVGIGSNLDDPFRHVTRACIDLRKCSGIDELRRSRIYRSAPMGPQSQPDYFNAVVAFGTRLQPFALLDLLQEIESSHGRQRGAERWGPRPLDLDLLLYGDEEINHDRLTVPHPGLYERAFVLYPLYDVAPDLRFSDGRLLRDLKDQVMREKLQVVE